MDGELSDGENQQALEQVDRNLDEEMLEMERNMDSQIGGDADGGMEGEVDEGSEEEYEEESDGMEPVGESACLFKDNTQMKTCKSLMSKDGTLISISKVRLKNIVGKSKKRKDTVYLTINAMSAEEKVALKCHRACVSTYTSKTHVKRATKKEKDEKQSAQKRKCRSDWNAFVWKEHCLFCGEACQIDNDE